MPEPAEQPAPPVRTWRPAVLWTLGILAALGLAWFVGAVVVPIWTTRNAVIDYAPWHFIVDIPSPAQKAIDSLGGQELAAERLSTYLRLPRTLAPHKTFAVELLGHCGPRGIAELIRALQSDNPVVQRTAATMLGQSGPQASVAMPDIMRLICLGSQDVTPDSAEDAADLRKILDHLPAYGVWPTRVFPRADHPRDEAAFLALAAMGPDAAPDMATLADSPKFRAAAAYWLSTQGDAATALLVGWLESPDEDSRLVAVEALAGPSAKAQHVFLGALNDPSAKVRCRALQVLRESRPASADVVREASRLLASDPDAEVRFTALRVLPQEPRLLIMALNDKVPRIRAMAAVALGHLGPLASTAIPALTEALRGQDPTARACAAQALGDMGTAAAATVADLTSLLAIKDTTAPPHYREVSALGSDAFLQTASNASPAFCNAASWSKQGGRFAVPTSSRAAALVALGKIGPAATKAAQAIELLLDDEDKEVRSAAASALRSIRGEDAGR